MLVYLAWQTLPTHGVIGVFDSVEKAKGACVEHGDAIQGPIDLNAVAAREPTPLRSAYWPDFEWVE